MLGSAMGAGAIMEGTAKVVATSELAGAAGQAIAAATARKKYKEAEGNVWVSAGEYAAQTTK